ncbi:MAG: TlpA disulfide reductase family protein [Paracoccus sp. (in: a-proteobacteria)]|nr:TlpA disulfide reductase family protein [Paracoccus sp. (in: a-proteobacteria)]
MLRMLVLYTALVAGANAAAAGTLDIDAAREGGLSKLVAAEAAPVPDTVFLDRDGGEHRLSDYRGKAVLLNFWAVWCVPCKEEMPALDRLQTELGGEDFEVVTIATGRNSEAGIDRFFEEEGIENLPYLTDARMQLARSMGVVGLPVTVLIDREGNEVARVMGDEEWDSEAAFTLIRQLIEM